MMRWVLVAVLCFFASAVSAANVVIHAKLRPWEPIALQTRIGNSELAPKERPKGLKLAFGRKQKPAKTGAAGSVCGRNDIKGRVEPRVNGRIKGCGIASPVRLTSVAGVRLTNTALMDCKTARALQSWVTKSAKKSLDKYGGGLASMHVAASYSCRTRNNIPGARLSNHSFGKAIDLSAFVLKDGTRVTVLKDWSGSKYSKALRSMHKKACGPFKTVLGPKADRYHQDHFHFDTDPRGSNYCR